jgi:hypothetical protein
MTRAGCSRRVGPRISLGDCTDFARQYVPIRTVLGLDLGRTFYKKSLVLLSFGRIAQRESVPFTRERSKVRSLVRPPRLMSRVSNLHPIILRERLPDRCR